MNKYYDDMPQEYKDAFDIIKKYCQNEDCDIHDCKDCKYSLATIRCNDTYNETESLVDEFWNK